MFNIEVAEKQIYMCNTSKIYILWIVYTNILRYHIIIINYLERSVYASYKNLQCVLWLQQNIPYAKFHRWNNTRHTLRKSLLS